MPQAGALERGLGLRAKVVHGFGEDEREARLALVAALDEAAADGVVHPAAGRVLAEHGLLAASPARCKGPRKARRAPQGRAQRA
eukprot:7156393-Lingulodinium_polyedra.AAC.1